MALDCVLTPPSVDQGNKDTKLQTDGENESDKPEDDEETDIDLEEGEILDSGEENEVPVPPPQDIGFQKEPSPLIPQNEAYRENENIYEESDDDRRRKKKKRRSEEEEKKAKRSGKKGRYVDHDQVDEDNEDLGWTPQNLSQIKRKLRREESPHDSNMSGNSDEEGLNFRDFRGDNRSRGNNNMPRNNRKGRGAVRRQRMSQERNTKGRKRKVHEGKKFKNNTNRIREKREPRPKQICKYYLDGKCTKKNECQYSHDITQHKKQDLCKFYLNGFCAKAETCLFMHEDFPCKFYHLNGKCNYDSFCRFSHAPLTDDTRMILEMSLKNGTLEEEKESIECNTNVNKVQRPSLLGSPPRHVKEAAEEWQQDLIQRLQARDKKIDFGCHNAINFNTSPMKQQQMQQQQMQQQPFIRPGNFYVDTLQTTPPKNNMDINRLNMDMGGNIMGNNMPMNMMGDMSGGNGMGNMIHPQGLGDMNGAIMGDMNNMNNINNMNMMGDFNGPMNCNMNGSRNGPRLGGPMMGNMNNMNMNNMNMQNMGDMNMQNMGDMNMQNIGDMNMQNMGEMNMQNMGDMNMQNMNNMNMQNMGDMNMVGGNSMMGNMNGPRMLNNMGGGPMMGPNFPMPFMNQDLMNQDNRDNFTPPRNNQTTPIPTDDEEAQEFDQFLPQARPVQGLQGIPNAQPVNNFYEDDEEDVVVAGGIDDQEDDQYSERILEVKKTAVMGCAEKSEMGLEDSESQSTIVSQSPTHDENSSDAITPKPPIAIPVHLPKRTRELFLRIQQHQKKNLNPNREGLPDSQDKDGEESNISLDKTEEKPTPEIDMPATSTKGPAEKEPEVKAEPNLPEEDYNEDDEGMDDDGGKANWLSSDEDDDNGDQPLTDVLKKLQQMPPPTSVPTPAVKSAVSGPIDIAKMLNNIRQQATQSVNNNSNPNNSNNFAGNPNFWQNIFSAAIPFHGPNGPNTGPPPLIRNPPYTQNSLKDKMSLLNNAKSGALLPPPSLLGPPPIHLLQQQNTLNNSLDPRDPRFRDTNSASRLEKSVDLKKVPTARDPRLGARDPRMPSSSIVSKPMKDEAKTTPSRSPKPVVNKNLTNSIKSPSPPPSHHGKLKEKRPSIEGGHDNDKKPAASTSNYKLYSVTVSPLNYSSYLFATQNDKKLLNDPRLKKLLQNTPTNALQKSISLPFPPDLQNTKNSLGSPTTLQSSSNDQPKLQGNVAKALQEIRSAASRNLLKRKDSVTEVNVEPKMEVKLEPLSPPPTIIKEAKEFPMEPPSQTPKPAIPPVSHLPKNFTDPRMARLHQITDPRRSRHMAIPKKSAKLQLPKPLDKGDDNIKNMDDSNTDVKNKSEPKGGSLNRKKSLDYASPLNAYPETESSSYNSYNRRPNPVTRTPKINNVIENTSDTLSNPISIPSILPPLSEPSPMLTDLTTDSETITNQSLKEVFKTIDPTASPFC